MRLSGVELVALSDSQQRKVLPGEKLGPEILQWAVGEILAILWSGLSEVNWWVGDILMWV